MNETPNPVRRPASLIDLGSVVALLFVLSGATALVYQVVFLRSFVELYGSTSAALGASVGAFLLCLAIGAALGGWWADRSRRPLRSYAALEAIAALGGVLAVYLLGGLESFATELARKVNDGESVGLLRGLASVAVMIVPVAAMGATLPVLARFRALDRGRGVAAGVLQAANTLGALIGVSVAAWVMLPELGLSTSLWVAVSGNAVLALGAWLLSGLSAPVEPARRATVEVPGPEVDTVSATPFLIAALGSGFLLIGLEVLFFRGLSQITRGSVESVATLLGVVLFASALGTAAGTLMSTRDSTARTGFLLGHLLTAAGIVHGLCCLYRVDPPQWEIFQASQLALSLGERALKEAVAALVVVGPAAFFAGTVFPCVSQLRPRRLPGFGGWVGAQSAAWTLGAAFAGMGGAAMLIPAWGLRGALLALAALPLALVAVVLAWERGSMLRRRMLPLALGLGAVLLVALSAPEEGSPWSQPLQFFRAGMEPGSQLLRVDEDRVAYIEGEVANVSVVVRPSGQKVLKVDNQEALGGSGASRIEAMQALLPSLLHENPQRALVLGVGAGVTVGTLLHSGVPQVDAVELIPEVLDSLPYFAYENGGVLTLDTAGQLHPMRGLTLHPEDARTFVRGAEEGQYDLIIGDLFFPWKSEAGFLYTREHFERVRRLLAPGGVFCQWLPGHQLRWEEIGIIGRTFCEVFDGTTLWLAQPEAPTPVLGLVAGKESMPLDVQVIRDRVQSHPAPWMLESNGIGDFKRLLSLYVADEFLFRNPRVFDREELNTADRPLVEFMAARRIELDPVVGLNNRRFIADHKEDIVGRMSTATLAREERAPLQQELSQQSRVLTGVYQAMTYRFLADANRAIPPGQRPNEPWELEHQAFQILGNLLLQVPEDGWVLGQLGSLLEAQARREQWGDVISGISSVIAEPQVGRPASLLYLRGKTRLEAISQTELEEPDLRMGLQASVEDLSEVLEAEPDHVQAQVHLGIALFLLQRDAEAQRQLQEARERLPELLGTEIERLPPVPEAILRFLDGRPDEAAALLERAESWFPFRSAVARRILG